MKAIYILLTKSGTMVSRMLHFITDDDYTHASISFDESLHTLYSSARKNGRTMFPAGPCVEHLNTGVFKESSHIPCVLYELMVSDESYEAAKREVERIMVDSESYHYNIVGLLLCYFNIPFVRRHHFFCSQFVSTILDKSAAIKLPKDSSLMKPVDYMAMPELRCLYKGKLENLRHIAYSGAGYARAT